MIFYFSGTGNSLFVAKTIAEGNNDEIWNISKELEKDEQELSYSFGDNDILGIIFPVHAWGPPDCVERFVSRLRVVGGMPYIFTIATCGEEEGYTSVMLSKALQKSGIIVGNSFTIKMPNGYVIGYDVEPIAVRDRMLSEAETRINQIMVEIKERDRSKGSTIPGNFPFIKSRIINKLFRMSLNDTKKYYATDSCTRCGLCAEICPVHSIAIEEKPKWGERCEKCFACINRCPENAIQFGKSTESKGRYHHPSLDKIT